MNEHDVPVEGAASLYVRAALDLPLSVVARMVCVDRDYLQLLLNYGGRAYIETAARSPPEIETYAPAA